MLGLPLLLLWGCADKGTFVDREEPWRADNERACLLAGVVRESQFVHARAALGGPSVCGALRPFEMVAVNQGAVSLSPPAMVQCQMVPAIERFVAEVVQPAARAHLGRPVVELKVLSSYSCRPRNGVSGEKLSEHGHANAIDVGAFRTADGRWITVREGWSSWGAEGRFLRAVHQGGCRYFTTVLGPNANSYHADHFHFDLARHGRDPQGPHSHYCR